MITCVVLGPANFERYGDDISELEKASFRVPWSRDAYKEESINSVAHLWVFLLDGVFVGYTCFWVFAGELHLLKIAILQRLRRQGLGSLLMERIAEAAVAAAVDTAWLEVRPSNIAAINLYLRHGFTEVGRRPGYYRDTGEDAILMSRVFSCSQ